MTVQTPRLSTTTFTLAGVTTDHDVRQVTDAISTVPDVGAVAIELTPDGGAALFLKHKDGVELNRATVDAALRRAGNYLLLPDSPS